MIHRIKPTNNINSYLLLTFNVKRTMLKCIDQQNSTLRIIPLKHLIIDSTVRSFAADVHVRQIFVHHRSNSVQTEFHWIIPRRAVIYSIKATIDRKEIVADVKNFTDGIEIHMRNEDELIFPLGWISPMSECQITICYVVELDFIDDSILRLTIPKTIVENSRNYSIEFQCHVEDLRGLTHIQSSSHQFDVNFSSVKFSEEKMHLDRDIFVDLHLNRKHSNVFSCVEDEAAMVAVIPFEDDLRQQTIDEYIFLLDCSSSMRSEKKIEWIRQSMFFFLQNLPEQCYFNIILFGSIFRCLFNRSSAQRNSLHLRIAERLIEQIDGDFGATDLSLPLVWLQRHPPVQDRSRHVLLLSDGQSTNLQEIFRLTRSIASTTRIFSFAFGSSFHLGLIQSLARITRGDYVTIPLDSTSLDRYLRPQWKKICQRSIRNIQIEWNFPISMQSIPKRIPLSSVNDRLLIYGLTIDEKIRSTHQGSLTIRNDQSYYRLDFSEADRTMNSHSIIKRLACQALIDELEDELVFSSNENRSKIEEKLVEISLKYEIFNQWTKKHRQNKQNENDQCQTDEDIVRSILKEQNSAGLWDFPSMWKMIEKLSGKSLHVFQSSAKHRSTEILLSIIIIVLLESKFSHLRLQWDLAADRARRCLIYLMENNWKTFVHLFKEIRDIIEE